MAVSLGPIHTLGVFHTNRISRHAPPSDALYTYHTWQAPRQVWLTTHHCHTHWQLMPLLLRQTDGSLRTGAPRPPSRHPPRNTCTHTQKCLCRQLSWRHTAQTSKQCHVDLGAPERDRLWPVCQRPHMDLYIICTLAMYKARLLAEPHRLSMQSLATLRGSSLLQTSAVRAQRHTCACCSAALPTYKTLAQLCTSQPHNYTC